MLSEVFQAGEADHMGQRCSLLPEYEEVLLVIWNLGYGPRE